MTRAELKIIIQVRKDGTLPKRVDWRTITNLQNAGEIHFSEKTWDYQIGPQPKEVAA